VLGARFKRGAIVIGGTRRTLAKLDRNNSGWQTCAVQPPSGKMASRAGRKANSKELKNVQRDGCQSEAAMKEM